MLSPKFLAIVATRIGFYIVMLGLLSTLTSPDVATWLLTLLGGILLAVGLSRLWHGVTITAYMLLLVGLASAAVSLPSLLVLPVTLAGTDVTKALAVSAQTAAFMLGLLMVSLLLIYLWRTKQSGP